MSAQTQEAKNLAARHDLTAILAGHPVSLGPNPKKLMRGHAQQMADAIIAAGFTRAEGTSQAPQDTFAASNAHSLAAIAYEQRTANLIALLEQIPEPHGREQLHATIIDRLGL